MGRDEVRETADRDFCLAGMQDMFRRHQSQESSAKSLGCQAKEIVFYLVASCLRLH